MIKQRLRGLLRRVYKPQVLRRKNVSSVMDPRMPVVNDNNCVFMAEQVQSAGEWVLRAQRVWNEMAPPITGNESVLIKINLNTADPYPASTDPEMASALIDLLRSRGIRNIMVADCCSISALPTRNTARQNGIVKAIENRAEFVSFDEGAWAEVPINGHVLKSITVPKLAIEVDHIIHLANLKTHVLADFSFGFKLGVGYMHPLERLMMHKDNLQQKLVEISLAVPSDLTIIDGRQAFIDGGPIRGRLAKPGLVLMGTNPLAVDLEAYRQTYRLKKLNNCLNNFSEDPWSMPQFKHIRDIGLAEKYGPEYLIRSF